MKSFSNRTALLYGDNAVSKFKKAKVALFGLGGVGGTCYEFLLRSGIGHFELYDHDVFEESNLNRQILSNLFNLTLSKVEVAFSRAATINPQAKVRPHDVLVDETNVSSIPEVDVFVDCIDDIRAKVALIKEAHNRHTKIFVCLGTGKRMDPTALTVVPLSETSGDPFARRLRQDLRKEGLPLEEVECVYSKENPIPFEGTEIPSSMGVPSAAGLILGALTLKYLAAHLD